MQLLELQTGVGPLPGCSLTFHEMDVAMTRVSKQRVGQQERGKVSEAGIPLSTLLIRGPSPEKSDCRVSACGEIAVVGYKSNSDMVVLHVVEPLALPTA